MEKNNIVIPKNYLETLAIENKDELTDEEIQVLNTKSNSNINNINIKDWLEKYYIFFGYAEKHQKNQKALQHIDTIIENRIDNVSLKKIALNFRMTKHHLSKILESFKFSAPPKYYFLKIINLNKPNNLTEKERKLPTLITFMMKFYLSIEETVEIFENNGIELNERYLKKLINDKKIPQEEKEKLQEINKNYNTNYDNYQLSDKVVKQIIEAMLKHNLTLSQTIKGIKKLPSDYVYYALKIKSKQYEEIHEAIKKQENEKITEWISNYKRILDGKTKSK